MESNLFCEKCGFKIIDNSNFCEKCGSKISKDILPKKKLQKKIFIKIFKEISIFKNWWFWVIICVIIIIIFIVLITIFSGKMGTFN